MCDRSLIVRICIIIIIITLSMMRKTELNTLNYRLIVGPCVLRGVPKAEVDLNTALYAWDRRQCLNLQCLPYSWNHGISCYFFHSTCTHNIDSKVLCNDDRYFMSLLSISQQLDYLHKSMKPWWYKHCYIYGFKIYLLAWRSSYMYIYI